MTKEQTTENKKAQKFKDLAESRLEKAVHAIKLIAPLADKNRYEYSESQVKYLTKTLKDSVRIVEGAFQGKVEKEISLPD